MLSISYSRERRQALRAYKAQLVADNIDLLRMYAECLGVPSETLLHKLRPNERDLFAEEFGDYLSDLAEKLAA